MFFPHFKYPTINNLNCIMKTLYFYEFLLTFLHIYPKWPYYHKFLWIQQQLEQLEYRSLVYKNWKEMRV